jgi:hypothetical protein
VLENEGVVHLLGEHGLTPRPQQHSLRGIASEITVYEIP